MNSNPQVQIYDTTLRDGSQGEGVSFSVQDKLKVARLLDELGVQYIEGGWPGSNPKDIDFFNHARDMEFKNSKLAAFGSTRRAKNAPEDDPILAELLRSDAPVITLFGKSWTFHVTEVLRTTPETNLEMIRSSVAYLKSFGREVIYDAEHFFDGYKNDSGYALASLEAAVTGGADLVALCDTNGGSLPWEVEETVKAVIARVAAPVGIHTHNDSDLGTANAVAAIRAGAVQVQGTMNGWGERIGNANLCSIVPVLQLKMGRRCLPDERLARLTETAHKVSDLANVVPQENLPFVGRSAFAHKAGMHVDAVYKNPQTFEHIDPEKVGNVRRFLISELAGGSSVAGKAKEFGIDLTKNSPETKAILDRLTRMENEGYAFEGAEASFELLIHRALGEHRPLFELCNYQVVIDRDRDDVERIVATVKINVGEKTYLTAAEGDGPVNALDGAMRQALRAAYPEIDEIHLVDYKVRVLSAEEGTAAKVRVLIESSARDDAWNTVGVSTNIVEASWHALVDALEYGLRYSQIAQQRSAA
ncbi:MAG: citramalate synthase [Armatimonadetes bacterium]|nr:citramalate synthase [Armatimonadota bacterium]